MARERSKGSTSSGGLEANNVKVIVAGLVAEFHMCAEKEQKRREPVELFTGDIARGMIEEARDLGVRFGRLLRRARALK